MLANSQFRVQKKKFQTRKFVTNKGVLKTPNKTRLPTTTRAAQRCHQLGVSCRTQLFPCFEAVKSNTVFPSISTHPSDIRRLLRTKPHLRESGNGHDTTGTWFLSRAKGERTTPTHRDGNDKRRMVAERSDWS